MQPTLLLLRANAALTIQLLKLKIPTRPTSRTLLIFIMRVGLWLPHSGADIVREA
jgi:hypothetical protein